MRITKLFQYRSRISSASLLFLLMLMQLLLSCAQSAYAKKPHVIVLLASGTTFNQINPAEYRNIQSFLRASSLAIVGLRTGRMSKNDRQPANITDLAACVTLGAGAPAVADISACKAENAGSGIVDADFYARTGVSLPRHSVAATEMPYVRAMNQSGAYQAVPGQLGSALRSMGYKTAAIGNSDIPGEIHRECIYIVCDRDGISDYGDVASAELKHKSEVNAFGIRTDSGYLVRKLRDSLDKASFVVLDCGDTLRADYFAEYCLPQQLTQIDHLALESLDRLLGQVVSAIGKDDYLIMLSPCAPGLSKTSSNQVGWMAVKGPGFGSGLLMSPSTRRKGVVVLTDFAPTILGIYDIAVPESMNGRAMRSVWEPSDKAMQYVARLDRQAGIESERIVVMRGSSIAMAVMIAFLTLVLLTRRPDVIYRNAAWLSASLTCIPFALIVSPLVSNTGALGTAFTVVLLVAVMFVVSVFVLKKPERMVSAVCGVTLLVVAADLLTGCRLLQSSAAGYSLAESARFYGIGNEAMGMVLGCVFYLLGSARNMSKAGKLQIAASVVILFAVFLLIGSPAFGSNVGGALATIPAAVVFVMMLTGKRVNLKWIFPVLIITIVALSGIFAYDYLQSSARQSHAARMVGLLQSGGAGDAFQIIVRKLQLNVMLVGSSLWSRLLGVCVLAAIIVYRKLKRQQRVIYRARREKAALVSLAVAVAGAFVFNDSGVVAAAICSIYLWLMIALRFLETSLSVSG